MSGARSERPRLPSIHPSAWQDRSSKSVCEIPNNPAPVREKHYFGGMPSELPEDLRPIIPTGRAHQSTKNDPYVEPFEAWITSEFEANRLYGMPRGMPRSSERVRIGRKPG